MARVDINLRIPRQKLSQDNLNRGRYALANQALADMNQFVPKKENILRETGHVDSDGKAITWNTAYAKRMFYNYMYNYTTPGTGPRWDMRAERLFISDWIKAFERGADW
ncbi:minor capsid protein [Robertmurraya sp. FSL W8-0741]|uniref:minor capsid protein n=1 Tax=Robertmurraya sp. FSL W8-0741 TaxID=2954629 RepID=UPI0030F7CC2B